MQTIGAILGSQIGRNYRPVAELPDTGSIGIELELEGGRFNGVPGWDVHNDGSLRDGVEYVFRGAQGGSQALDSILAMGEAFKGMKPKPTFRCSTHCHLDVRDLTIPEVHKLVAAYSIMEDVMFDHCEEYRRWSNFCTPYFATDRLIDKYVQICDNSDAGVVNASHQFPKYSSFNLQPIHRFGSVEFRGSHALVTGEDLLSLAQRMLHLKRLVLESPKDQTLGDFIAVVNKMNPIQAFPQGLSQDYKRDQELADVCYSNALRLQLGINQVAESLKNRKGELPQFVPLQGDNARVQLELARAALARAGNRGPRPEEQPQALVPPRVLGFHMYGLRIPGTPVTMGEAVRVVASLSNIQGIQPPRIRDLFAVAQMPIEAARTLRGMAEDNNLIF